MKPAQSDNQEPVAWIMDGELFFPHEYQPIAEPNDGAKPLYTAPPISDYYEGWEEGFKAGKNTTPPSKPWVSLTDGDIKEGAKYSWVDYQAFQSVAWWADEKLKEKNT